MTAHEQAANSRVRTAILPKNNHMPCERRPKTTQLLLGGLDHSATIDAMNHVRQCAECRSFLTENSRVTAGRDRSKSPDPSPREERERAITRGELPGSQPYLSYASSEALHSDLELVPPKKRRLRSVLILAAFAAVVSVLLFLRDPLKHQKPSLDAAHPLVLEALDEGRPHLVSPRERVESRPKILNLVLPPGNRRVHVTIETARKEVWSGFLSAENPGTSFDRLELKRADGALLSATECLAPFPGPEVLPLVPGNIYTLWATLPNGVESLATRLQIEPKQ